MTTLATQTSKEGDAHSCIAGALINEIITPMKNLAESQNKDRKSVYKKMFILFDLILIF